MARSKCEPSVPETNVKAALTRVMWDGCRKSTKQYPMHNIRWYVGSIGGVDPDAAPASSRRVIVIARYDSPGLDAHAATHEFEVWVSTELKDLSTIERAVYRELREHLEILLSSLPARRPRSAPRP